MALHWTDKRRIKVTMARHLEAHGWEIKGFKEDKSDSMTDYYDPASWDGIAVKDGFVFVMMVTSGPVADAGKRGYITVSVSERAEDCQHCGGSGEEPDGWTYEEAKANPVEFNKSWTGQGVALYPDVVSPLHFIGNQQKCQKCHGVGHFFKSRTEERSWPTYSPNPKRKKWHLEQNGKILCSGIGLQTIYNATLEQAHPKDPATNAACNNIRLHCEAYMRPVLDKPSAATEDERTIAMGTEDNLTLTLRRNHTMGGMELQFNRKPSDYEESIRWIRDLGDGWRWSRRQNLWYTKYSERRWQRVMENMDVLATIKPIAETLAEPPSEIVELEPYVPPPGIKIEKFDLIPNEAGQYVPCNLEVITNPADDVEEEVIGEVYTLGTKADGTFGTVPTGEKITRKRKKADLAIDASYGRGAMSDRSEDNIIVIVDWSRVSKSLHPKLIECGLALESRVGRWRYGYIGRRAQNIYREVVEVIKPYLEAVSLGKGEILEPDGDFRAEIEVKQNFGEKLEVAGMTAQQGAMF